MRPLATICTAWFLMAGPAMLGAQTTAQAEKLLESARHKEVMDGDLKAAIEQYRKIAAQFSKQPEVAAQALLKMGQCQEKLGQAEARKSYERIVREYSGAEQYAAAARARLAALGNLASGPNPRLIAEEDGWEAAGPSPDGRFLLEWGTNGDMYLSDLQAGQTRRIVKEPWWDAAISPDGRQVAFLRRPNNTYYELRIVGTDGSAERLLWKAEKDWGAWGVQWFPDGKRIMVPLWQGREASRIVAISATDGAVKTVWEGKQDKRDDPRLSPDGKSVVYTRRVRDTPLTHELWLLRLEDRSETLLFEGQSYLGYPQWTPDGAGVVFLSDRRAPGVTLDLWLLRTSGGRPLGFPALVKTGLGEMSDGHPAAFASGPITRDGTYYFHRKKNGEMRQLLTTKFDPETGKTVGAPSFFSRKGGESWSPSFSRDGRWLAYLSKDPGSSLPSLVIQSVETGEERVVPTTPNPLKLGWVTMFPDGRSVLVRRSAAQG